MKLVGSSSQAAAINATSAYQRRPRGTVSDAYTGWSDMYIGAADHTPTAMSDAESKRSGAGGLQPFATDILWPLRIGHPMSTLCVMPSYSVMRQTRPRSNRADQDRFAATASNANISLCW